MGYTSSPLLLISLTAAFSKVTATWQRSWVTSVKGVILSVQPTKEVGFFFFPLAFPCIRQGNAVLWDAYPCTAAGYPAVGSDNLHLCWLLSGHWVMWGFMSLKLCEKQLGLDCGFQAWVFLWYWALKIRHAEGMHGMGQRSHSRAAENKWWSSNHKRYVCSTGFSV